MNGFSHHYLLGESTSVLRGIRCDLILFSFSMKILCANRIAPDGTPHSAASRTRRHIWGYSVCLCPIKGTQGLNELKAGNKVVSFFFICQQVEIEQIDIKRLNPYISTI